MSVTLYDAAGAARAGEASTTKVQVVCLDNGYMLDSDGTFKTTPGSPLFATAALPSPYTNLYQHRFNVSAWPRGQYLAMFSAAGGEAYEQDFTVGLMTDRKIGYSAVYSGTVLTLSVWVEEDGIVQTEYVSLVSCKILNSVGSQITGGGLSDNTSPTAGVFTFVATVALTPNTNYIFDCVAQVAGGTGVTVYQFPLRAGLQRP